MERPPLRSTSITLSFRPLLEDLSTAFLLGGLPTLLLLCAWFGCSDNSECLYITAPEPLPFIEAPRKFTNFFGIKYFIYDIDSCRQRTQLSTSLLVRQSNASSTCVKLFEIEDCLG